MAPLGIDDPRDYHYDVFDSRDVIDAYKLLDSKAVVGFAKRIEHMSNLEVESLLMRNGAFSPELVSVCGPFVTDSFRPWREMLRNWSAEALKSVEQIADTKTKRIHSLVSKP